MKALLIVAHGSRRAQSNEEIAALTNQIEALAGDDFGLVSCAFLELADPSIPDGITDLVARGAKQVCVVPYFLAAGTHVKNDIPAEVEKARVQHADIAISMTGYLGAQPGIAKLLLGIARNHQ